MAQQQGGQNRSAGSVEADVPVKTSSYLGKLPEDIKGRESIQRGEIKKSTLFGDTERALSSHKKWVISEEQVNHYLAGLLKSKREERLNKGVADLDIKSVWVKFSQDTVQVYVERIEKGDDEKDGKPTGQSYFTCLTLTIITEEDESGTITRTVTPKGGLFAMLAIPVDQVKQMFKKELMLFDKMVRVSVLEDVIEMSSRPNVVVIPQSER